MVPNNLNAQYAEDFFKEKAKVIIIKINKKRYTRCKSSESFKKQMRFHTSAERQREICVPECLW